VNGFLCWRTLSCRAWRPHSGLLLCLRLLMEFKLVLVLVQDPIEYKVSLATIVTGNSCLLSIDFLYTGPTVMSSATSWVEVGVEVEVGVGMERESRSDETILLVFEGVWVGEEVEDVDEDEGENRGCWPSIEISSGVWLEREREEGEDIIYF